MFASIKNIVAATKEATVKEYRKAKAESEIRDFDRIVEREAQRQLLMQSNKTRDELIAEAVARRVAELSK